MVIDVLTTIAVVTAVAVGLELLETGIGWLIALWGKKNRPMPETLQVELSDTDRQMAEETQKLMREVFGDDIAKRYAEASALDRINMTREFSERLAKLYGVDVDIDVFIEKSTTLGYYCHDDHKLRLNIYMIDISKDHEHFNKIVELMMIAIIHEMRHAVQHKALEQPGFWNIDDVRRAQWARNFENYIQPSEDAEMYQRQVVEADANTFAGAAVKGMV